MILLVVLCIFWGELEEDSGSAWFWGEWRVFC